MNVASGRATQHRAGNVHKGNNPQLRPASLTAPAAVHPRQHGLRAFTAASTPGRSLRKATATSQSPVNPPATQASLQQQVSASSDADLEAVFAAGVQAMFDCLNRRDLMALAGCLAADAVYQSTSEGAMHSGRDQVVVMYRDLMSKVPSQAKLIIDDLIVSEGLSMVDVTWHVELGGVVLPMSRGTTICWLATDGCVTRIRDFTEVPMALALQALSVASPALDAAVPLLPSLQGVLAVAGMLGQQPSTASSSNSSSTSGMGSMDAGSAAQVQAMPFFTLPSLPTLPFLGGWPQQEAGGGPGSSSSSSSSSGSNDAGSSGGGSNAPMVKAWDSGREIRMRTLNPPSASNGSSATKATSTSAGGRFATTASTSETAAYTVSTSAKSWGRDSAAQPTIRGGSTVVAAAPAAPVVEAAPVVMDLSGVWSKDLEASDSAAYEVMLDLLGLSGLQRVTARLLEGIEVQHVPGETFDVSYLTVVPFFRVTESTRIGYQTTMMRRDLRPGQQRAVAEELPAGGVRVSFDWSAPNAGALQETYVLEGDRMSVLCNLAIGNRRATTLLVYKRMQGGVDELLRESRERNSSLDVVLARQRAQFGWK